MKQRSTSEQGSTLVVTISVVAMLLVCLGAAVEYTTQISRATQRTRNTAVAMEIADGHLEVLFSSWRNIYRNTWTTWTATSNNTGGTDLSILPTNYFFTSMWNPGPAPSPLPYMSPSPAPTPPLIQLPSPSNFPNQPNYTVTQFRIQAVNPMIMLNSDEDAVTESGTLLSRSASAPAAYGPYSYNNLGQYSFYYLAAVDVKVPSLAGNVTAKVRRVFEKKFDNPWTFAMFYVDDLELQPDAPLTLTGPIHTNGTLYIGTSNFYAATPSWPAAPTSGRVEYASDYVNGYSPKETQHTAAVTAPNFAKSDTTLSYSDMPPSQVSPYLPFGWNVKLDTTSGSSTNNDSYREIIESRDAGTDAFDGIRYYSQKPTVPDTAYPGNVGTQGYTYRIIIDASNSVTVQKWDGVTTTTISGSTYSSIASCVTTGRVLQDNREGGLVRVTDVNVGAFSNLVTGSSPTIPSFSGILYITDSSATTYNLNGSVKTAGTPVTVNIGTTSQSTTRRAIRLINGATLKGKLTVVSNNLVYIQGDYNTGGTFNSTSKSYNTPSDSGTYTSPTVTGYTRWSCAVIADAIGILSGAWQDSNSVNSRPSRVAANVTVNAALVSGNVPSGFSAGNYSGGGENFVRFLEDWGGKTFCYYGSMMQLFQSQQAIGVWTGSGNQYSAPTLKWFYDVQFGYDPRANSHYGSPPGDLMIAAYLQQQRWYQVY